MAGGTGAAIPERLEKGVAAVDGAGGGKGEGGTVGIGDCRIGGAGTGKATGAGGDTGTGVGAGAAMFVTGGVAITTGDCCGLEPPPPQPASISASRSEALRCWDNRVFMPVLLL